MYLQQPAQSVQQDDDDDHDQDDDDDNGSSNASMGLNVCQELLQALYIHRLISFHAVDAITIPFYRGGKGSRDFRSHMFPGWLVLSMQ